MLCGIFVGGRARRMGGEAKGLLPAPGSGEPLVVRLARIAGELGCEPVLVGAAARYQAALPDLRVIVDEPVDIGPLGGLNGLLGAAAGEPVIALACDMPHVSAALLARLATPPPVGTQVLAARADDTLWQPLCARYEPTVKPALELAIAQGVRSFQRLFAALTVSELTLSSHERDELVDWDTPEDVQRSR